MIKTEKIIWAAGFIDGEAYVGITRGRHQSRSLTHWYYRCQISVGQVHRAPLDRLQEVFGGSMSKSKDKYGTHYQWRVYGKNAIAALKVIQPYLIAKQAQAALVLEFWETKGSVARINSGKFSDAVISLNMDIQTHLLRESIHTSMLLLNRRRERLSEEAPTVNSEGDAIVRPHGNNNHESVAEMTTPESIN